MIQFLKSILSPSTHKRDKEIHKVKADVIMLRARLTLVEEENKKAAEAIQDLSKCIQAISIMTADLAGDVTVLNQHVSSLIRQTQSELDEDDIFKKYMTSNDDDGGGYLN